MRKVFILFVVLIVSVASFAQKNSTKGMIMGSTFGSALVNACVYDMEEYVVNDYTASESFKNHSKSEILKFYKSLDFNNTDKWVFNSLLENSDGTIIHKYTSTRKTFGTNSKIVRIRLKEENNVWKIIIPKDFNQTFK